jgi:hypothetical protein
MEDKNKYIVKDVAKQKRSKARCRYETMSVLEVRCYLNSLGYKGIRDTVVRNDLYKLLKKDKKALHLFVEFPDGLFSLKKEKRLLAEKEYLRRIKLF